jgi:sterol desaturase/sphingolipid hydroxylase (fatty acid hydroxylase superfamily)
MFNNKKLILKVIFSIFMGIVAYLLVQKYLFANEYSSKMIFEGFIIQIPLVIFIFWGNKNNLN